MRAISIVGEPPAVIQTATKFYASVLLVGFALIPAYLIAYLYFFQNPGLTFESHPFHEFAITVATLEGTFIAYVSWRCYLSSGEPLLRWLTLGFLGFTLIYVLHGAFTGMAHHSIWLFLLYGPASRLAMAILLFAGQLSYQRPNDAVKKRTNPRLWLPWIALFILLDAAVAAVAYSPFAGIPVLRTIESGALVFSTMNVAILTLRRIRSPLITIYGISITSFALSSLAFLLGKPWNHMWWLAHIIFAGGFLLLSYGVIRAFLTTRSFTAIYTQEELMARLSQEMTRTESALQELKRVNHKLEHLATTDPLTGAANRRHFIEQVEAEIARARRDGAPFSLLALDLDHFKAINDNFGHLIGDEVLREFVRKCLEAIRPYDGMARVGGEEFMVLLPQAALGAAQAIAERIRSAVASTTFDHDAGRKVLLTVSIGVSQFGLDGNTIDTILRVADERLYRAKSQGRNRVVVV